MYFFTIFSVVLALSVARIDAIDAECRANVIASSKAGQKLGPLQNGRVFPMDFTVHVSSQTECKLSECFGPLDSNVCLFVDFVYIINNHVSITFLASKLGPPIGSSHQ